MGLKAVLRMAYSNKKKSNQQHHATPSSKVEEKDSGKFFVVSYLPIWIDSKSMYGTLLVVFTKTLTS